MNMHASGHPDPDRSVEGRSNPLLPVDASGSGLPASATLGQLLLAKAADVGLEPSLHGGSKSTRGIQRKGDRRVTHVAAPRWVINTVILRTLGCAALSLRTQVVPGSKVNKGRGTRVNNTNVPHPEAPVRLSRDEVRPPP